MSAGFTKVAKLSSMKPGVGIAVDVNGKTLALFLVDGVVHAIEEECPHAAGPLSQGTIEDGRVYCPFHGWCFSLKTGKCEDPGGSYAVGRYDVRIEGDEVWVKA